jgi:glycosyltransferase involved in cell wall biosynthesis/prefoldin subunit 5
MADLPLVSVVIPAYNHAHFVREAVRSVLTQTMADLELIVVDDGSTDETAKVVRDAFSGDPRARLLCQVNAGSHAAIRTGLSASRAPWLAILNSDDRWAERRLQQLLAAMIDGGKWGFTGVRLINETGEVVQDPRHWWHRTQRDFRSVVRRVGPLRGLLYGNYTVSTSNFFFHRDVLNAVGMPKPLKMVPDWEWALRMAHTAPDGLRYMADDELLDYRLHGRNTIMSQFLLGDCEVSRMHRSALGRHGTPPELISAVFRNQRDLRRHWRALGVEPAQAHVRQREAEVLELTQERDVALRHLCERDLQLVAVTQERDEALDFLSQRDAQLLSVTQERDNALDFLVQRDAQLLSVTQERDNALDFLAQRDAQLLSVTQERDNALDFLAQRDSDVQTLKAELDQCLGFLRDREADVTTLQQALRAQQDSATLLREEIDRQRDLMSDQARQLLEAESSWVWRCVRWMKRRWGFQRL